MAAPSSTANTVPSTPSTASPAKKPVTEQVRKVQSQDDEKLNYLPGGVNLTPDRPRGRKLRSVSDVSRSSTPVSTQPTGRDDSPSVTNPATPQRAGSQTHGLSLQVPPKVGGGGGLTATPAANRVPLSPKLDSSQTYGSPASVLPRRSRGLDFSRASTNLHHSTLAEASPESSPVVPGRGVNIPQRKPMHNSVALGSPSNTVSNFWTGSAHTERLPISSSISSVNMLDSESSSSSDDDEDESLAAFDRGDPMAMTPQAGKTTNAFSAVCSPNAAQSPGGDWMPGFSAAKASLMNFQRARFGKVRSRHSSTSTSGNSPKQSPVPISPPVKSVEAQTPANSSRASTREQVKSRRESLSLGTRDLYLSDISDEGEAKQTGVSSPSSGSMAGGSNAEGGRRGVVKRAVTRRGNLLPKSRNFARIRAALFEECTPVESEVKREAEVIRQVRESEPEVPPLSPPLASGDSLPTTTPLKDPGLAATSGFPGSIIGRRNLSSHDMNDLRNSLDTRFRTPPPNPEPSEPNIKDAPVPDTTASYQFPHDPSHSRSSTPFPPLPQAEPTDIPRNANKRRRNDDLDLASFKRRAVSPAMSVQSSPVLPQAPAPKDYFPTTGQPPKNGSHPALSNEGSNVSTSGHSGPVKRVGMQGMNETNDGLMKMSID